MRRLRDWLVGWYETLHLRFTDPDTYRFLVGYQHDPDDFTDAERPGR